MKLPGNFKTRFYGCRIGKYHHCTGIWKHRYLENLTSESTDDTDIMKLTNEYMSQPADSKAVHRVKQFMGGMKNYRNSR